ncbi:MAG: response regulator [Cellvibrionaceae bacterium]
MNPAILIVDDEKSICSALKRTFHKQPFRVFSANSGQEALDLLAENTIDVVVSDQRMPGMKGTELLSIVKKSHPKVGRIILSGHSDIHDLTDAINEASINRFLQKPWKDEHLIQTVKNVIQLPSKKHDNNDIKKNHELESRLPLGKPQIAPYKPSYAISSLIKETYQFNLEKDIKADRLLLDKPLYQQRQAELDPMAYYQLVWPAYCQFGHKGIVNIANQSGYLQDLYSWYLLSINEALLRDKESGEHHIIDLFSELSTRNNFNHELISKILQHYSDLRLRISFNSLKQSELHSLLDLIYQNNHSLLLNVEKRVINIQDLHSLPVSMVEMDGDFSSIDNGLLSEKRLKMLSEAQNCGIKTILSQCRSIRQHDYAVSMGFDYF